MGTNADLPPDYPSGIVVEVSAAPPPLYAYVFLAVTSDVTLSGFFVDDQGLQCAAAFSMVITSATPRSFQDSSLSAIPAGAKGFVGKIAGGDLYYCFGGKFNSLPAFIPNANCPVIPVASAGNSLYLGRVAG